MTDLPPYPGTPKWVKVTGIVLSVLVLLILFVVFTGVGGPHGPSRHMRSDDALGDAGPPYETADESPASSRRQ